MTQPHQESRIGRQAAAPQATNAHSTRFGVFALVGGVCIFVVLNSRLIFALLGVSLLVVTVGALGALVSAVNTRSKVSITWCIVQLVGVASVAAHGMAQFNRPQLGTYHNPSWDAQYLPGVLLVLVGAIGVIVTGVVGRRAAARRDAPTPSPAPVGYTTNGQPIYPVVGYTSDGQPVTADRAVGVLPAVSGTNGMAIGALIASLTLAPLGIIFGHIALSQIKRSGQAGRGLAVAGLILGYVSTAVSVAVIIFLAVGLHNLR